MTFDEWFKSQQGVAYENIRTFARGAWGEQQIIINQLQAQLESEKLSHAAWEKQSLLEYSELTQEHISLVAALTTIGDAQAGTSAMELQVFARNVLKGLKP